MSVAEWLYELCQWAAIVLALAGVKYLTHDHAEQSTGQTSPTMTNVADTEADVKPNKPATKNFWTGVDNV